MKIYSGGQKFPNQIDFLIYIVKAISKRISINIPCIGAWQVKKEEENSRTNKHCCIVT
jgi:hypothetical protein